MELTNIVELKPKTGVEQFGPGDTVRVSYRVVEGNRERIQVFEGVVIRRRQGGVDANFTVRRVGKDGIGVERTFLLNSPRLEKLEVTRKGKVRRANLYFLRGLTGKAARIKDGGRLTRNTAGAPVAAPVEDVGAARVEDEVAAEDVAEGPVVGESVEAVAEPTTAESNAEVATGDEAEDEGENKPAKA